MANWVILVVGWGSFVFKGTEAEAEEMRVHKARWERAIAKKRPADASEVKSDIASGCWNHPGFKNRGFYVDCPCDDENCVIAAQERIEHQPADLGARGGES